MSDKWCRRDGESFIITMRVQPGAKRNEVAGYHGDALKLRLAAPPIDGRANQALQRYIADLFEVHVRHVTLLKGERSQHKVVRVENSRIDPKRIITT